MARVSPLPFAARAALYTQLAQLEHAGLPIAHALQALSVAPRFQPRIIRARALLASGLEFTYAAERSQLMGSVEASLIRAAMQGGRVQAIYTHLAAHYTDRARQQSALRARLWLPVSVWLLALIIQPLPEWVSGASGWTDYAWTVGKPLLWIALLLTIARRVAQQAEPRSGKSLYQRLPIIGPLYVRHCLHDFLAVLALLLESGLALHTAWSTALPTLPDADMRRALHGVLPRIAHGAALTDAVQGVEYLTEPRLIQLLRTAEASGTLPATLRRYASHEASSLNGQMEQLTVWIPRLMYAAAVCWLAYGLLTSNAFAPGVE